jgi:hypothetical protein
MHPRSLVRIGILSLLLGCTELRTTSDAATPDPTADAPIAPADGPPADRPPDRESSQVDFGAVDSGVDRQSSQVDFGVDLGRDVGGPPGECVARSSECTGAGSGSVRTCSDDGHWQAPQACPKGCSNGSCQGCMAAERQCVNGGEQICNPDGTWGAPRTCSLGCSTATNRCRICDPVFTPTRCMLGAEMQEKCLNDGSAWGEASSCNGKGCLVDRCNTCTPKMEKECTSDNTRRVCQMMGTWGGVESCPNGCTAGECRECPTTGAARCVIASSAVQTCSAAGFWQPSKSCPGGCNAAGSDCAADAVIVMFRTELFYTGDLGGRAGADGICNTEKTANFPTLSCPHVRAFLTVSDTDEIRDMPGNYGVPTNAPVQRRDGTIIDSSFPALLDGNIMASIDPTQPIYGNFWSGAGNDGSTMQVCDGWTNGTSGGGSNGHFRETQNWLFYGGSACYAMYHLVCLCW